MHSALSRAPGNSTTDHGHPPAEQTFLVSRPSLPNLLANPRRVQTQKDLTVGCEISITGGPHRDHGTGVITGQANSRFWWVVSTTTRMAKSNIPFQVEKCYTSPL